MSWYLKVLKNYAGFSGRARRKEYWFFILINVIIAIILGGLDNLLGLAISPGSMVGPLYGLYMLAIIIPSIAVAVRRLHDTSRSGWWILISLVPAIGTIVLLIFFFQNSKEGPNNYGPNPKTSVA